jgi:hypothetical protein
MEMTMKKTLLWIGIVFTILTFCGIGYVLVSGGKESAIYAVTPMAIAIAAIEGWRRLD